MQTVAKDVYNPYPQVEVKHEPEGILSKKSADISFSGMYSEKHVSLSELPINFIWFGSVIPKKYFDNISCWASHSPNRLVVLWFSSDLLTKEQCTKIEALKLKLPANIEFLDVCNNPVFDSLGVGNAHKLIFKDLESFDDRLKTRAFCLASDLYRVALMYHGTEVLKAAGSRKLEHFGSKSKGVIYLDTDKYFDRLGCMDCYFKGVLFSNNMNDTFAASENHNPFFYQYLMEIKHNFDEIERSGKPIKDTLDSDFELIKMAGCFPMDEIYSSLFTGEKVKFPFENMDDRGSDRSWCQGEGLKLGEAL